MPKHFDGKENIYIPYNRKYTLEERVFRREFILSCILGNGDFISNEPYNIAKPTIKIVDTNYEWSKYKFAKLKQIMWTKDTKPPIQRGDKYIINCPNHRVFRSFYKRMYKGRERIKHSEKIIQYMTSAMFLAIISIDKGFITNNSLSIDIPVSNHLGHQKEMAKMLKCIYGLDAIVKSNSITFNKTNTDKLLKLIKPKIGNYTHLIKQDIEDIV